MRSDRWRRLPHEFHVSGCTLASAIAATLANKLALDYPPEKLEILVVSDGSTDRTDAIVASFAPRGVRLLRQEPRGGKTAALNRAVAAAEGEIIVT